MNSTIRVTKEFRFEMAHVLWNYDGPCKNVHGHSYRLFVTIAGIPVDDPQNRKNGMVIDFTDLKALVRREILDVFDHAAVISRNSGEEKIDLFSRILGNMVLVDYQPTCENLVADFANRIGPKLPRGIILHNLRLYETSTSYAEWFASDQDKR